MSGGEGGEDGEDCEWCVSGGEDCEDCGEGSVNVRREKGRKSLPSSERVYGSQKGFHGERTFHW